MYQERDDGLDRNKDREERQRHKGQSGANCSIGGRHWSPEICLNDEQQAVATHLRHRPQEGKRTPDGAGNEQECSQKSAHCTPLENAPRPYGNPSRRSIVPARTRVMQNTLDESEPVLASARFQFGDLMHLLLSPIALVLAAFIAPTICLAGDASPHYDKDQITAHSNAFRGVAEVLQVAYMPLERKLSRTDSLLAELDLNLALSTGSVDAAQHKLWVARLNERSGVFGPEFEAIQSRIRQLETGFEESFQAALDRALAALRADGVEPIPCAPRAAGLGSMAPGFADPKSSCPGENLSTRIAGMWDQDPALKASLEALVEAPWPDVTSYADPAQTVAVGDLPASSDWLSPAHLGSAIPEAIELIDAVERIADRARSSLRAAYDQLDREASDFKEKRAAISDMAKGIRAFAEDAKAAAGEEIFASLTRSRRKGRKAGWSKVSVCLNPTGWGGCAGKDRTDEVTEALVADRTLQKSLDKIREGLVPPVSTLP